MKDRLAVVLGGRAAEKALLHSISSGADDDIRAATALARAMVSRWGMSEAIGPVDVRESEEHPFLVREIAWPRTFSEETAHAVDEAVHELLDEAEARAADVIKEHRKKMVVLVAALEDKESLDREDIESWLGAPNCSKKRSARAKTALQAAHYPRRRHQPAPSGGGAGWCRFRVSGLRIRTSRPRASTRPPRSRRCGAGDRRRNRPWRWHRAGACHRVRANRPRGPWQCRRR